MNNINEIDLLLYSPKYSNKQNLFFKIINKNQNNTYDIQFEDETIFKNIYKYLILEGEIKNPNSNINFNSRIKILFHHCYNKALQCQTRLEFQKKYPNFYKRAQKIKWIDELCSHMIQLRFNYSKQECHEKALLCKSRSEFSIKYTNYYATSSRNQWTDEICSHMIQLKHSYTKQECQEKALLCKSRSEFARNYPNHYQKALRTNWLDEICSHMIFIINQYEYDRIIYAYIFEETKSVYIGLTNDFKERTRNRRKNKNDTVTKYIKETNLNPKIIFLTDYIPAINARLLEIKFINQYRNDGWNILNKVQGGSLGGGKYLNIVENL